MPEKATIENLLQELRRGTLILCVMCKLKVPMYGYSLIDEIEKSNLSVEAGTLYPLLRRLEKQGLLESNWEIGTKPRKYYRLSENGKIALKIMLSEWQKLNECIIDIAKGDDHE